MKKKIKGFFVSGTDTGIGKTIISAILVSKLSASYWKPIQCGRNYFDQTDSDIIKKLSSKIRTIYPESYVFKTPLSPNIAAEENNTKIKISNLSIQSDDIEEILIIEGAGGLMVPINDDYLMIDYIKHLSVPLILVSSTKLGTINHTLLSLELIKRYNIILHGVIFNGKKEKKVTSTIIRFANKIFKKKLRVLGHIPILKKINKNEIKKNIINIKI